MDGDAEGPHYSIDSSALIHGWVRAYPPATFPKVWERIDGLIAAGLLRASVEVLREIKKKDDDLHEWCKARPAMFVEIDDATQEAMQHIMGTYPKLVDTGKGKSGADSFVIALAQSYEPVSTVVTEENGGGANKPKIPYVCRHENVRCINLLQLIVEQRWTFS